MLAKILSGALLGINAYPVEVPRIPHRDLADPSAAEPSSAVRSRVEADRQPQRLTGTGLPNNAQMQARHIRKFCAVDDTGQQLLAAVTDLDSPPGPIAASSKWPAPSQT